MPSCRSPLIAALAGAAALALGAPAAGASIAPIGPFGVGASTAPISSFGLAPISAIPAACGTATGAQVQGRTGGVDAQVCGGLSFIGPAVGQIDTTIGPTIISPAVTGAVIVTGNNVAIGP